MVCDFIVCENHGIQGWGIFNKDVFTIIILVKSYKFRLIDAIGEWID